VTYTKSAAGGCAAITATTSVTITAVPTATISYTGTPFCTSVSTAQSVTRTGTGAFTGGIYSASPAGLTIDPSTGAITPNTSTPGTYTVTYTIQHRRMCSSDGYNIRHNHCSPSATISYAGTPFCKSVATAQSVTRTGTAGGVYSASPAGLIINAGTGAITPSTSTAGTYTVTYTIAAAGGCAAFTTTTSVTITAVPTATISYAGTPFCTSLTAPRSVTVTELAHSWRNIHCFSVGLTIDPSTGAITRALVPLEHIRLLNYPASGGCAAIPVQHLLQLTEYRQFHLATSTTIVVATMSL
jgi:hypothetical protein